MNFTNVDLDVYKKSRNASPYFTVGIGGNMAFSPSAIQKLNIEAQYLHFAISDGAYWFYINNSQKNGLKIRLEKKDQGRAIAQCSAFVQKLIKDLDLPLAEDKKKSVQLDIDFEGVVEADVLGNGITETLYKLF